MQPIGGEDQKKANGFTSAGAGLAGSPSAKNNNGNGTAGKPTEGGALGGMNFNFTPFGQSSGSGGSNLGQPSVAGGMSSTTTVPTPAKRLSIDESWVNVDWTEVNRSKSEQQQPQPPKSPRLGPAVPAASVLHPSFLKEQPLSSTPQKEVPSSFGSGGGFEKKETFSPSRPPATSTTIPAPSSLFNLPKPMGHEERPAASVTVTPSAAVPKSPTMKPMTPAKEPMPLRTESSMPFASKITPTLGGFKSETMHLPPKPTTTTPAKAEEKPAPVHAKTTSEPAKLQKSTPVAGAVPQPSVSSTPAVKPSGSTVAAPSPAKAVVGEAAASASKSTPKTKTPRKSAQATPTTPRSSGRTRKSVDRLSPGGEDLHHESKSLEIPAGSGSKFGDIPHITKELGKRKSDYQPIITLHRIIFGRPGEAAKRKGNLRGFHGMSAGEDVAKIAEKLTHHQVEELREICGLLNLEHSGEKKSLVERIAKYLMKPADLGESKPSPRRAAPQKRGKGSPASAKKGKRGKVSKPNKAAAAKVEQEEEEGGAESGSEGDDSVIADLEEGQEDVTATQ